MSEKFAFRIADNNDDWNNIYSKLAKEESSNLNNAKEYAVDGVLHYAKALSKEYNVVAIAVSGQTKAELLVTEFYWEKGKDKPTLQTDKQLLSIDDYIQLFKDQSFIQNFYTQDIVYKARYLNEEFNNYSIPEFKRCTMTTAMLLALIDDNFRDKYENIAEIEELGQSIISAVNSVFDKEDDIVRSKTLILRELETILKEPLFTQNTIKIKIRKIKRITKHWKL